jgi:hypothetical protein
MKLSLQFGFFAKDGNSAVNQSQAGVDLGAFCIFNGCVFVGAARY